MGRKGKERKEGRGMKEGKGKWGRMTEEMQERRKRKGGERNRE